jgi:uncharacterized protein YwqG
MYKNLDASLKSCELTHLREILIADAQKSLRLRPSDDDDLVTRSRIGGEPDVPAGFNWPLSASGAPLSFMAQIDLADLAGTALGANFKGSGVLSFFYDADQQPWGFDPKDRDGWRVFHFTAQQSLSRMETPEDVEDYAQFPACPVRFEEEMTFSDLTQNGNVHGLSDEEFERAFDFQADVYGDEPIHRMMGYPQLVQSDWRLECQLASNGIYVGDSKGYESAEAAKLKAGADDWILLLQIDSDDAIGFMWGDLGRLYFCINKNDLAQMDFSKVWVVLQCT